MKSILVVDSDSVTASLTSRFLRNYAYEVVVVSDARAALEKLNEPVFDVVLTDTRLTGMTGFDLVKMMRKCYIEVPVVFFGSDDDAVTRLQAEQHEALAFISKRSEFINLPHLLDRLFFPSLQG
ncbi:MAG: response regulator [Flavobacteriales bacterium]|jgi:two-component system phosphate regulon response regulator OmpR